MNEHVLKALKNMTPQAKLDAALRLRRSAWKLKSAALKAAHPDWTEEKVQREVAKIFLYARS